MWRIHAWLERMEVPREVRLEWKNNGLVTDFYSKIDLSRSYRRARHFLEEI